MEKTIWAVQFANFSSGELVELLNEEWEPFAVTETSPTYRIWLRKIVRVEVEDETE